MSLKDELRAFRERERLIERASNEAYFDLHRQVPIYACEICKKEGDESEFHYCGTTVVCNGVRCHRKAERR
jgi:hypothetical protein